MAIKTYNKVYKVKKNIPFYVEDVSGSENVLSITKTDYAPSITVEKSLDGEIWEVMGTTSSTSITATIPANSKMYLRANTNGVSDTNGWGNTFVAEKNFNVGGNLLSLVYGENFTGEETKMKYSSKGYGFSGIFQNAQTLISAEELICEIEEIYDETYRLMFNNCSSLTTAPKKIYYEKVLNSKTWGMCSQMFQGCTSLTSAPELPTTTMSPSCYAGMFKGCTSLTSAPELPATTLANSCYANMFQGCTSLTTAPVLPANILVNSCYSNMFNGCTNLSSVTCLATNISASYCTSNWLSAVSATGTFYRNGTSVNYQSGASGRPSTWTLRSL